MGTAVLTSLLEQLVPFARPRMLVALAERFLRFQELISMYDDLCRAAPEEPLVNRLLRKLEIAVRVSGQDLAQIPATGSAVVVFNHPTGILDGAVVSHLCSLIRRDTKILANALLGYIPELAEVLIPVDVLGGKSAAHKNAIAIRKSIEHLQAGGLLIAFPAGEVSHFQWRMGVVSDSSWSPAAGAILRKVHERSVAVS